MTTASLAPQAQQFNTGQMADLKEKNLRFFKQQYPDIYAKLSSECQSRVEVRPQGPSIEVIYNQQAVYKSNAKERCAQEVKDFLKQINPGQGFDSIPPAFAENYTRPRFFSKSIQRILKKSPIQAQNFQQYYLNEQLPMMICLGVVSGLHIKELLERKTIQHLVVFEADANLFLVSCCLIDWQKLCRPFLQNPDKSIRFIIGNTADFNEGFNLLWNQLIKLSPLFPLTSLFYNHLGLGAYERLFARIQAEIPVLLGQWGYYDDEINQLNQGLHNIQQGLPSLKRCAGQSAKPWMAIVGAGPSLDSRIQEIKQFQEHMIIVSCGTALKTLKHYDLVPDIHVELESALETYRVLKLIDDPQYLKKIHLIAAAQIPPQVFGLFKSSQIFFKDSSVLSQMFGNPDSLVYGATPTCVNAALALGLHLGFEQVLLYGCDFGFSDPKKHHAEGSVYYDRRSSDNIKNSVRYQEKNLMSLESVHGKNILTTQAYYTAKRRIEAEIARNQGMLDVQGRKLNIYNCSEGARIDGAPWLSKNQLVQQLLLNPNEKNPLLAELLSGSSPILSTALITQRVQHLLDAMQALSEFCQEQLQRLNKDQPSFAELCQVCSRMIDYLEQTLLPSTPGYYYFIRGTLWHYLYAGLAHSQAISAHSPKKSAHSPKKSAHSPKKSAHSPKKSAHSPKKSAYSQEKSAQSLYIRQWKAAFHGFLEELIPHLRSICLDRPSMAEDTRIRRAITEPVPGD